MPDKSEEVLNQTLEIREQLYAQFKDILHFDSTSEQTRFEIIKGYVEKIYNNTLNPNFRGLLEKLEGRINLNLDEPNETLNSILQAPERISFIRRKLIKTLACNTPQSIQASRIHKQLCTLEESIEYFVPNES